MLEILEDLKLYDQLNIRISYPKCIRCEKPGVFCHVEVYTLVVVYTLNDIYIACSIKVQVSVGQAIQSHYFYT